MMFIPNKPEVWEALRKAGLEEDARKLDRMTGFGLWMFWAYFAYLALFGLIALVWPSYPGIALTSWIVDQLPYGVFAVTEADLEGNPLGVSSPVLIHMVVLQLGVSGWLWIATVRHIGLFNQIFLCYSEANKKTPELRGAQTRLRALIFLPPLLIIIFSTFGAMVYYIQSPDILILLLNPAHRTTGLNYGLGSILWISGPAALWGLQFFFLMLIFLMPKSIVSIWQ